MPVGQTAIEATECLEERFIGTVVDIDEAEVIVLAVVASAPGMVMILKPVHPDYLRLAGEALCRCHSAPSALTLGADSHQMAVITVAGTIFLCGKKPLRD